MGDGHFVGGFFFLEKRKTLKYTRLKEIFRRYTIVCRQKVADLIVV